MRKTQGIKRLSQGKYLVTVVRTHPTELGKDGKPRKVKRKRTVHGSRQEAERAHDQLAEELEVELGLRFVPTRLTLSDYVRQWLELRVPRLKRSTILKYVNDLEKHILPVLGNRMLDEIRPSDVKAMLARDQGAPNSKKNRIRVLSVIAKDALADGLIERDFCARVSVKVPPVYSEEEPNSLTTEQLAKLLEHFEEEWIDAIYLIAFTGMRWCEVAGLAWSDIDLDTGVVRIRRANVKGHLDTPKTEKSRRTLALPGDVTERLRERHQRMVETRHPGLTEGWVFPKDTGERHRGYPLRKRLQRACEAAGIEIRFTQHGLRRTWNDLARRHVDTVVVRSIMGHTTEAMTQHYSSVDIDEKREAIEKVMRAVQETSNDRADSVAQTTEVPTEVTPEVTPGAPEEDPDMSES